MSLCRPLQVLSVHASKVPRKHLATRSVHAASYNASSRINTGRRPLGPSLQTLGGSHTREKTPHTTSLPVRRPSIYISKRTRPNTNEQARMVAMYEKRRTRNRTSVAKLRPSVYLQVFSSAVKFQKPELAESVVLDILEVFKGTDLARCSMLGRILQEKMLPLKPDVILRVLQHLKEASVPTFDDMITRDDASVARQMLHSTTIRDTDRPFLRLFYPALLERLKLISNPKMCSPGDVFQPPLLIYASFSALQKLLSMSFTEHALNIFQELVKTGYIPPEALHGTDDSSGNAPLIMSMAVIRSCLYWGYRALAANIMTEMIVTNPTNQAIIDLNIEVIHRLLSTQHPDTRKIATSGHLIRRIHAHSPVPDSTIRLFYDSAVVADAKEEAEDLYAFTRQERLRATHQYPPPQNLALPWLMDHFAATSSRTHLARTLAKEAVEYELWIPTTHRAQFIARTAALGYATQARALWERYVEGRDGAVIAGNSALMIRMVSLFWSMHRTNLKKATALEAQEERAETREKIEKYRKVSEDAAVLAERVRSAFEFHHAPLQEASHWDLTSFARACFIVGRLTEGYQAFKHLLMRKESPDLYDCNVALSAVGQINPRLAERMIAKMTAIGLRPDEVSFGTALHYAVMQGEHNIVDAMIERIRTLNDRRVSTKTLASLVRASLSLGARGTQEELRHTLGNIMRVIESFPDVNLAPQTQMGKALVYAAIQVQDGLMAYKYWKRLLKKGAQWDDKEQGHLRHGIAQLIRQPSFALPERRQGMLDQLGQRKMTWRDEDAPTT